jgi:homoserine O-acetyltransferase
VPIGKVIEGMNVADAFYADYGELAGGGIRGGKQDPIFTGGNDYLRRNFARLDYILKATIEPGEKRPISIR